MIRWPLMALTILAACGDAPSELATATIDTLPGGIPHVKNTGPTEWAGTNGWKLELVHEIHPEEGSPGELTDPRGVIADDRGNVFVLESRPASVVRFGPDGSFLGRFSRSGSGPGELSDRGLLLMVGDTLVIQDLHQTRATVWSTDGELINSWPSVCCIGLDTRATDTGLLPLPGMVFATDPSEGPFSGLGFVRFNLSGDAIDTVALMRSGIRTPTWDLNGKSIPVPLTPVDGYAFTPSGRVVGGHQSELRLVVSRTGSDTVLLISAPATRLPIPEPARREALDRMLAVVPGLDATARIDEIPDTYGAWSDIQIDGRGYIWLGIPGEVGELDHWQVFSPDGDLLGDVASPFTEGRRTHWGTERVHAVVEDPASGLPVIQVYRINRSLLSRQEQGNTGGPNEQTRTEPER